MDRELSWNTGNMVNHPTLTMQITMSNRRQTAREPAFTVALGITPARSNLLQRKCACGGTPGPSGECEECRKNKLQRKGQNSGHGTQNDLSVPSVVHEVLRSPGQRLDPAARAFMEPRFGHDFSSVKVHTDARAAESARAVNALAYTVGQNVVFGQGQYSTQSSSGRRLLVHELTHTVQQSRSDDSTLSGSMRVSEDGDAGEREAEAVAEKVITDGGHEAGPANIHPVSSAIQRIGDPSKIPPGLERECEIAGDSPGSTSESLLFGNNVSTLSPLQRQQIDNFVLNWGAAGGNAPVRVDGYASTPGTDELNWRLSCSRAEEVVNELTTPTSGIPGIPAGFIRTVAQGETSEFGAVGSNQRATISSPLTLPPAPAPPPGLKTVTVDFVRLHGSTLSPVTELAAANTIFSSCNINFTVGAMLPEESLATTQSWLGGDTDLNASGITCSATTTEEKKMYDEANLAHTLSSRMRVFLVDTFSGYGAAGFSRPPYCAGGGYANHVILSNVASGATNPLAHEFGHILLNSGDHSTSPNLMAPSGGTVLNPTQCATCFTNA